MTPCSLAASERGTSFLIADAGISIAGRLWGDDAVETSEKVAQYGLKQGMSANNLGIATTNGYWDALSGAAFCGKNNAVMVLVDSAWSSSIWNFTASQASTIKKAYVFGGNAAVSDATYNAVVEALE